MKKIEFLKTPGYVYDLFFLFVLHFNKKEVFKQCMSPQCEEYYRNLLSDFPVISEELRLFFYLNEGNTVKESRGQPPKGAL